MSYLLEHTADTTDDKAVRRFVRKNTKASSDEIFAAVSGYHIKSDQAKKPELARAHLEYLEGMITQTEVELAALPGMSEISATIILAETGVNMDVFDDAKHLCSWCGLSPSNNESAGKKKSVRIAKAGAYLKPLMVQCALAAIKSKKEPYFAIKYGRIKKRSTHKKAIIATARMMMVCIYHMVSEQAPFNPTDYTELMDPHFNQHKVVLTSLSLFFLLSND